jgi:23S rRNA pseudouridine2605 synthase
MAGTLGVNTALRAFCPAMTKKENMGKNPSETPGERIAKVMARAGLASRRQAEAWIAEGRVSVNGAVIASPALNVTPSDRIAVDGLPLRQRERTRLFLYNKSRGLVTTHSDPQGRPTIFNALPKNLPRLISIGRLDINTEGLLLLTNDGGLARVLELPATAWLRRYRVRANGRVTQEQLDKLRGGITVEGVRYGPIEATLDREQGANAWLTFAIREGKNREVRKVLETLGLRVNRLIRVAFGPFQLGELAEGAVKEIESQALRTELGEKIVAESGADFDAPLVDEDLRMPRRHAERARDEKSPTRPRSLSSGRASRGPVGGHPPLKGRDEKIERERDDKKESSGSRNFRKRSKRRDRSGGPRPSRPK